MMDEVANVITCIISPVIAVLFAYGLFIFCGLLVDPEATMEHLSERWGLGDDENAQDS